MDKRVILFGIVIIVAVFLFFNFNRAEPKKEVCFDSVCVDVEVVDQPDTRSRGLMFREDLGEFEGMLFIFDEAGHYPFWMKNTLIPLDIIWLDEQFRIVHIAHAEPCKKDPCVLYDPIVPALYTVEVNQGFSETHGIVVGQVVEVKV